MSLLKSSLNLLLILLLFAMTACTDDSAATRKMLQDYPDGDTDAAKLYFTKCGSCHAAPMPDIHRASRWIGIVARMQMHMNNRSMPALNNNEHQTVITYLQKHSRQP
ncbi:MAG: hypothetical protein GXP08_14815 [Gammaproteobacteria bacterium]|nr:hypothetical protein [Gammaproteobacteria bacterium]